MTRTLPILAALVAAAPALAQSPDRMDAAELSSEIFGVHLFGLIEGTSQKWDECIESTGQTVYRTPSPSDPAPYSQAGQLEITDDGRACFSYPANNPAATSCFTVYRDGDGYLFDGGATRFVTTRILRDVADCPDPGELIG